MKHLVLLVAICALVAALVLPSSLFASPATEIAPAAPLQPVAPEQPAPAPAEPAPPSEQPVPVPEQPVPVPEQPTAVPEQPAPAPQQAAAAPRHAKAAASGAVTIADFQFTPAQITVDQGDTVTWTNNGPTPHSATAPDGSFDTGILPAGQSSSHTFGEAGTYSYICTPHPNMHGTVVVRASQSGGDTPDSSTGDTGGGGGDTAGSGAAGAESTQAGGGPSLPSTGADAGALLILGALMLLLGIAVHRRVRAEEPRPAGRIGW
jgi:LPXTG-motif cell wall-anchored protein